MFVTDRWWIRRRSTVVVMRFAMVINRRVISGGSIFGIRVPSGFKDETGMMI
jgi:hypothetical protein